jgi:hypothetical protein
MLLSGTTQVIPAAHIQETDWSTVVILVPGTAVEPAWPPPPPRPCDEVYDVTPFVPRHPGGNMIWVKAGAYTRSLLSST